MLSFYIQPNQVSIIWLFISWRFNRVAITYGKETKLQMVTGWNPQTLPFFFSDNLESIRFTHFTFIRIKYSVYLLLYMFIYTLIQFRKSLQLAHFVHVLRTYMCVCISLKIFLFFFFIYVTKIFMLIPNETCAKWSCRCCNSPKTAMYYYRNVFYVLSKCWNRNQCRIET